MTEEEFNEKKLKHEKEENLELLGIDKIINRMLLEERSRQTSRARMILEKISADQTKFLFIDDQNEDLYVLNFDYQDQKKKNLLKNIANNLKGRLNSNINAIKEGGVKNLKLDILQNNLNRSSLKISQFMHEP